MKRLILTGPNQAKIIEEPIPALRPFDILCKVKFESVCGTDIEIASGNSSFVKNGLIKYPVPIGHEWSGIVEDFGSDATDKGFKKGDRVISETTVTCGVCPACLKKDYSHCIDRRSIGTINAYPGGFAEYIIIPYFNLRHIPDKVSLEEAALLEPTSIANHAIVRSKIYQNPSFAKDAVAMVTGTGGIGLAAAALLKNCYGVGKVIIAGRKDDKLQCAKNANVDVTINTTKQNLKEEIMKETQGKGLNLVIETSGSVEILNQLPEIMAPFGEIAPLAFYSRTLDGFDIDTVVNMCINILGIGGQVGLDDVIKFLEDGKLSLLPLISHRLTLEECVEVFTNPDKFKSTKIKILVKC